MPSRIEEVLSDTTSGSIGILGKLVDICNSSDAATIAPILQKASKAWPDFAVVQHFIRFTLKRLESGRWDNDTIAEYVRQWSTVTEKIANNTATILGPIGSVLVHSNSTTVKAALTVLNKFQFKVYQTKSLPGGEGSVQADSLVESGIDVILIDDEEVSKWIDSIEVMLLGSDAVSRRIFVNKIGSGKLCELFRNYNKPVYVLADSRKITSQVSPEDSTMFEEIPNEMVTGFINESSMQTPEDLLQSGLD